MRIIARQRVFEFAERYPDARNALMHWYEVASMATWTSIQDVRKDFAAADGVVVKSGRTVTVFNIRGGNYRLLTAIHYKPGIVFTMRFLTHREYDTNKWREQL